MSTTGTPVRPHADQQTRTTANTVGLVSAALGALVSVLALVLAALAVTIPEAGVTRVLELAVSGAVLLPGIILIRSGVGSAPQARVNVLPGEVLLAASLVYLGVAMPVFHAGGVSDGAGRAQFVAVLAGLWLGCAALALSGASTAPAAKQGVSPKAAVRDGVILIVGTILVAIALGQIGLAQLTPPKWNWISFLGITIPGMLILIVRELVKQSSAARWPHRLAPLSATAATETLLIVGLVVMLYGSGANLILGANGFTAHIKGNAAGLSVLVGAALFLAVIRGAVKVASVTSDVRPPSRAVAINLTYLLGAVAFIYGERSVVMGKSPLPVLGAAAPAAALILMAGALVLVAGRVIAHPDHAVT